MSEEWLINRSKVKNLALKFAEGRAHKFTRVSSQYLRDVNARLVALIKAHVDGLPSSGKTI